jgi:hypothetical protein
MDVLNMAANAAASESIRATEFALLDTSAAEEARESTWASAKVRLPFRPEDAASLSSEAWAPAWLEPRADAAAALPFWA